VKLHLKISRIIDTVGFLTTTELIEFVFELRWGPDRSQVGCGAGTGALSIRKNVIYGVKIRALWIPHLRHNEY